MPHEELKAEKLLDTKREMYEEMTHQRKMAQDSDYAKDYIIESNAYDIDKAKELLDKVVTELFEAGLDIKDWQILKEHT